MAIDLTHDAAPLRAIAPARHRPARSGQRVARRVLAGIGLVLLSVAASAGSAVLHLSTSFGREAARDGIVGWMSSRIRGTAHIGELTHLSFSEMAMTDFRVAAPDGETVIRTERMGGLFDWSELVESGTLQLAPCYFDKSEIWLTPRGPQGQVNLVHAMEVPDGRFTVPFEMNDIELIDNGLHIRLPGKPPVTMRRVHGFADLHVGHLFLWRMDGIRGYTDLDPLHVGFRHMRGRLQSDHAHPLVVAMLLDAEIAEPGARFDYHVPALEDREGRPYFEVDMPVDVGVSEARDDCAEGDEDHCAEADREEGARARERASQRRGRERAQERQSEWEYDRN